MTERLLTLVDVPVAFMASIAVALGLAFGSFLNVVIYRLPRGENLAHPPSRCPGCGQRIRAFENIPLLSFLFLRGKARCCKIRISPRYPLVEACGGLLALGILRVLVLDLPPETPWWRALLVFALYLGLGLGLIALAFIDLEHMYLPDEITIGGALLGLVSVPLRSGVSFRESLFGAACGFLLIWLPFDVIYGKVRGMPGMGLGDAKLVMLAGAWFGWQGAVFSLLAGAVQATLVALIVFLVRGRIDEPTAVIAEREEMRRVLDGLAGEERADLEHELARDPLALAPEEGFGKARLAFGPFLVLATLEYMLFGEFLINTLLAT
jgi:leader peptidase (prepilin peptidase)/N-methyltransferase